MSKYKRITKIRGKCDLTSSNICVPFCGEVLQVIKNSEIKSFCFLNIEQFFPYGMCKIGSAADSPQDYIEELNDQIIYRKYIGRLALKELDFTLSEGSFVSTTSINTDNTSVIIDYYGNKTLQDNFKISITDTNYTTVAAFKEHIKDGYIYYVLKASDQVHKSISPKPDYNILSIADASYNIVSFKTSSTAVIVNSDNPTIVFSDEFDLAPEYVTKKHLEYVFNDLSDNLNTKISTEVSTINSELKNYVKSINTSLLPDSNGNVNITHVPLSDSTNSINTVDQISTSASYEFRASGGDDTDIASGEAFLSEVRGRAVYTEGADSSYDIISIEEEETVVAEYSVTLNEEKWRYYLTVTIGNIRLNDTYTVQYDNNLGQWNIKGSTEVNPSFNTNVESSSLAETTGITVSSTGAYTNIKFTITYVDTVPSIASISQISSFTSVGYNLFNAATNRAHVLKGEPIRFIYPAAISDLSFAFCTTDSNDNNEWSTITFETITVGAYEVENTYTPTANGYIKTNYNTGSTVLNQIMINLIWSGIRLNEDEVESYIVSIINFKEINNNQAITLNYLNGHQDKIDLKNKQIIQAIGFFNDNDTLRYIFGPCNTKIANVGMSSKIFVDFSTLNATVYDRIQNNISEQSERNEILTQLPNWNSETRTFANTKITSITGVSSDWGTYQVDDFGTETVEITSTIAPELITIYTSNLIDKLRNRVVAYMQQNPSLSEQQNVYNNLGLIQVKCYVSNKTSTVTATDENGLTIISNKEQESDVDIIIKLPHLGKWYFNVVVDNVSLTESLDIQTFGISSVQMVGKKYGFRRSRNVQSPSGRIDYIEDATDMIPVSFDEDGTFNPGSWNSFINSVAAPCRINLQNEIRYFNPNNQRQWSDGTDVNWTTDGFYGESTSFAMVEFRKYVYVKRWSDTNYDYVIFTDEKIDDTYQCYACMRPDGTYADDPKFYWGMYEGITFEQDGITKLKSAPGNGLTLPTNATITSYETYANNLGAIDSSGISHWHIGYKSAWDFICDLITLISKTDDAQSVFGPGRSNGNPTAPRDSSEDWAMVQSGGFVKSTSYQNRVKIFWITNFYGNSREPLLGLIKKNATKTASNANSYYYVKPAINYGGVYGYLNSDITITNKTTGLTNMKYVATNATPSAGFIATARNDYLGFSPTAVVSSENYYCDYMSAAYGSYKTYICTFGAYGTTQASANYNGPRCLNHPQYNEVLASYLYMARLTYV